MTRRLSDYINRPITDLLADRDFQLLLGRLVSGYMRLTTTSSTTTTTTTP